MNRNCTDDEAFLAQIEMIDDVDERVEFAYDAARKAMLSKTKDEDFAAKTFAKEVLSLESSDAVDAIGFAIRAARVGSALSRHSIAAAIAFGQNQKNPLDLRIGLTRDAAFLVESTNEDEETVVDLFIELACQHPERDALLGKTWRTATTNTLLHKKIQSAMKTSGISKPITRERDRKKAYSNSQTSAAFIGPQKMARKGPKDIRPYSYLIDPS